jgi:hypothetical protein
MACSAGNADVATLGDITPNEQGNFEPHQRGRVVPAFAALSRPLQGDDGSGPAVPVGKHMGQRMHLRLMIHASPTPQTGMEVPVLQGVGQTTVQRVEDEMASAASAKRRGER